MEEATGPVPVVKVLIALYPGMEAMNVLGPLEVLDKAYQNPGDTENKAFECVFVSETPTVEVNHGITFKAHVSYEEVQKRLAEFDILMVPGGDFEAIIKSKAKPPPQPLQIIRAFADVQQKHPERERTVFTVGIASMYLGQLGMLAGLSATTHPDYLGRFETLCAQAAQRDLAERPNVMEARFVVNNLRFDLGDPDENPYIRKKSDAGSKRRPSNARKGSNAWKESSTRRESITRRASLILGGLRVITAGGTACAIDAALYIVSIYASVESATEVGDTMMHNWQKGVVVDGIDV